MRLFRKNRSQQQAPVPQLWKNSPQPNYPDRPNRMRRSRDWIVANRILSIIGGLILFVVVVQLCFVLAFSVSEISCHHQIFWKCNAY